MTTWLITGCSSGLGRALATAVLDRDENVVVTARDADSVADLAARYAGTALALPLNVTDDAQRRATVEAARQRFGGIDVLVNNAGHSYRAAVEEGNDAEIQEVFDANFFGPAALIRAVLPVMREQEGGTIVNVSSIGARACNLGSGYYVASKAALEAMTGSLRREVEPMGITVILVEPGAFRTSFLRNVTQPGETVGAYAATVGARRAADPGRHGSQAGDPARAAEALITAVSSPAPPRLLVLGSDAVQQFRDAAKELSADVDAWEDLSLSTDFPD